MGKYDADFWIASPAAKVFAAACKAVRGIGWHVLEENTGKMELVAKSTDDFLRHPPPEEFSSWHQTASLGTIVYVSVKESEAGSLLHLESKTRFRMTIKEGRTKRDVEWLYEETSKLLASN